MKIVIKNKLESREGRKGVFAYSTVGQIKTGYLAYDSIGRNIGIVYFSDDEREKNKHRYGMSELFFNVEFEKEYGTWKIIKIDGEYLPFSRLEKILSSAEQYELWID